MKTPPSSKVARVESLYFSSTLDSYQTPPSRTSELIECLSTGSPPRHKTAPKPLLKLTNKRSSATGYSEEFQVSLRFRPLLKVILTHHIYRLHLIQYIKLFQEEILVVNEIFSGPATEEVVQTIGNIPMTKRLFRGLKSGDM